MWAVALSGMALRTVHGESARACIGSSEVLPQM
jgi:hypothetical protein